MPATETFTYTLPSGATIEVQNLSSDVYGAREVAAVLDNLINWDFAAQNLAA